jgi:WhiB family transcriptional regulator, redox-sensing transcriptional regulator
MDGVMNRLVSILPGSRPLNDNPPNSPAEGPLGQPPTPWRQFALCLGHDSDLWFPVERDGGAGAVAICSACPVRLDCLGWALEHNERQGIWGGISAGRREQMRADARAAAWGLRSVGGER